MGKLAPLQYGRIRAVRHDGDWKLLDEPYAELHLLPLEGANGPVRVVKLGEVQLAQILADAAVGLRQLLVGRGK